MASLARDFDQIVERALRNIPPQFRSRRDNVATVVEDEPALTALKARGVSEGKTYRQAAIAAGYSQRSASCLGSQLMKMPLIADRVRELKAARPRLAITRESVLQLLTAPDSVRAVPIRDETGQTVGFYVPLISLEGREMTTG